MPTRVNVGSYSITRFPEDEEVYAVRVPSLPGCISYGRTVDEAAAMAKEAIALNLENLKAHRYGGRRLDTPPHHLRNGEILSNLWGPPHLGSYFLANSLENLRGNLESATMASEKTTRKRLRINFRNLFWLVAFFSWSVCSELDFSARL